MADKGMIGKNSCLIASLMAVSVLIGCAATHDMKPLPAPSVPQTADLAPAPITRPGTEWSTNTEAMKIIEDSEGLRLHAYRLAGQVLIGYGHAVTGEDTPIADDLTITEHEARKLLRADIAICEDAVRRVLRVDVTRNQFSAMVAFCYNVGQATFMNSSIVRHLNNGEGTRAADAFLLYDKAALENEKRQVARLAERRIKERYLFLAS